LRCETGKRDLKVLRGVAAELGGIFAWRAILMLEDSGGGGAGRSSGNALQARISRGISEYIHVEYSNAFYVLIECINE